MRPNTVQRAHPVPAESQLVVLPFLAAIEGFARGTSHVADVRVTMHRVMVRRDQQYLQQITDYLGSDQGGAGRVMSTDTGVAGAAYQSGRIYRTKHYEDGDALIRDLGSDMQSVGDHRAISDVAKSYLAIPFKGGQGGTVLVLYLDSGTKNRFADDALVASLVSMCHGFARVIRSLHASPMGMVRNFALVTAKDAKETRTLYPTIQEYLDMETPDVSPVSSFNFESAAR